jgi:hypothetical protein
MERGHMEKYDGGDIAVLGCMFRTLVIMCIRMNSFKLRRFHLHGILGQCLWLYCVSHYQTRIKMEMD